MNAQNEIILYNPSDIIHLEVRLENETVWLTQAQMVVLFERDRTVITRHINNIFKEGELDENITCAKFAHVGKDGDQQYTTTLYNLDVVISVGYRVKSQRGTQFRIWANKIIKDYLLRGYVINQRLEQIDSKLALHDRMLHEQQKQIDFVVRTELPPKEGVFYDGQIFASDLIKSAQKTIVLLDNYVDETVLLLLSKRGAKVDATIYTKQISKQLHLDLIKHNAQYEPVSIRESATFHDRFLIIDDTVYHIGASLKDLGRKLFAFSKMEMKAGELLRNIH
ncbi:MAG: virulence RhuM family protein [Cytophagaceae bacterium]|jgi:hypothetical protein|nr:virulence RhuM family protein [Cytophagaceae bacterium]